MMIFSWLRILPDLLPARFAMDYRVELDTFRGPLDLLLYLVKRNEVDICDIPIARITEQFLGYLNDLQTVDVEWAGEFLVLASTLMEIKSRMLLPRPEEGGSEEEDDPRMQLVRQLIEYKKFRDAANALESQAEQQLRRLSRQPVDLATPAAPNRQPIHKVELWDLVSAFGRLIREISALQPRQIVMDDTPIHITMERILDHLRRHTRATLAELFTPPHTRGRLIGLFLATLELIKGKRIVAEQLESFGEIALCLTEIGRNEKQAMNG
jgi:segregation and condensation protein A